MNKYNFPHGYKPKVNFEDTVIYKLKFKHLLMSYLMSYTNALVLSPSVLSYYNSNSFNLSKNRKINFDNKNTKEIYEIRDSLDNYMSILLLELNAKKNINSIISDYTKINRDAICDFLNPIATETILLEIMLILENQNIEYFKNLLQNTWNTICSICKENALSNIHINTKLLFDNKIDFITNQELEKNYPTQELYNALNSYIKSKKILIIEEPYKKLKSGRSLLVQDEISYDKTSSCALYVYSEIHDKPIILATITSKKYDEQSLMTIFTKEKIEGDIKKNLGEIVDKANPVVGLEINFTNVILFLLEKYHSAEVTKSTWQEDFLLFCLKNNIRIF